MELRLMASTLPTIIELGRAQVLNMTRPHQDLLLVAGIAALVLPSLV